MGQRNQEPPAAEALEDLFETTLGDLPDELMQDDLTPVSSEKQRLVKMRRLAE